MLFCINTRITPGPISQVLPGRWVRHSQYSKKLFVRHIWKGINCLRRMSYTTTLFWNTETFEETKMTVASGLSRYTSDHVYVCKKKIFPKLHWKPHTSVYLIHSHMSTLKIKFHRCRRSVDCFLIDWSICHGRYPRSMPIHLLENTVDIAWTVDFRQKSVEIHRRCGFIPKKIGRYRPLMCTHTKKTDWRSISTVEVDIDSKK